MFESEAGDGCGEGWFHRLECDGRSERVDPHSQPVLYRPMFGSFGSAIAATSTTFVSRAAVAAGLPQRLELKKMIAPVENCRRIGKKDMLHNSATPNIEVDPETYEVRVDGKLITCEPASVLPLAQRYFLF